MEDASSGWGPSKLLSTMIQKAGYGNLDFGTITLTLRDREEFSEYTGTVRRAHVVSVGLVVGPRGRDS